MFDLEEINLMPSTSGRSTQTQEGHAMSTAKKIAKGGTFFCNRIKAEVGTRNCKSKYHYAKAQGLTMSPCLECAKVLAMLRNDPTPVDPQPTIDPKEIAAMARPAKKGTPDPIQREAKTEPKLEIVTKPTPEVKEKAAALTSPFDGWKKYDPKARYLAQSDDFATLTGSVLQFSSKTTQENGLREYQSVDLHYRDGRIGCVFHHDERGALKVRPDGNGRVVFSAQGFARAHDVPKEAFRRRSAVVIHGPGVIEVNLKKEVAA